MDIIDDMNGRGLGASDVFVALLSLERRVQLLCMSQWCSRYAVAFNDPGEFL